MIKAVIFDLDGVLVTTDGCHYSAWKRMADEEGIPFDETVNKRLRGVSRMESLGIILEKAVEAYSTEEKKALATRKNGYYVTLIDELDRDALLPGAINTVLALRDMGIRTAIGSSSRNAPKILNRLGITDLFHAVVDGNGIKRSKPAPDVFLLAAEKLGLRADECLVVEDADAGVEAAINAGMRVLAVGAAQGNEKAHLKAVTLEEFDLAKWIDEENRK